MIQVLKSDKPTMNHHALFVENRSKRFVLRNFFDEKIVYDRRAGRILHEPFAMNEADVFASPTFESIAPLKVYFDPSYHCNLSCRHCLTSSSPHTDTSGELPLDRILKLVEEVAFSGAVEIGIGGGEPLVYPHIYEVLTAANNMGVNTVLTTNGTLITPEIANRLREQNLYEVRVSFEGYGPIHDDIRGQGQYQKALKAIALLAERKLQVKARLTLTRKADQGLHNLYQDLSSCGVNAIKVTVVKAFGRAAQNEELLIDSDTVSIASNLIELGRKYDLHVELSTDDFPLSIEETKNKKPRSGMCSNCGAGLETVYISPTGYVYPCTSMMYYPLGRLNESYMGVLKNERASTYRTVALDHSHTSSERHICRNHSFLQHLKIDHRATQ